MTWFCFLSFISAMLHAGNWSLLLQSREIGDQWQIGNRVPAPPGKSWKVLDFFSLNFQDLESPGKSLWSWKVLEIEV